MHDQVLSPDQKELLTNATITGLYVHPLKGGRRQFVEKVILTARGMKHDRELMAVTADGNMCTLRGDPQLALITTSIGDDTITMSVEDTMITVPILHEGQTRDVTVHSSKGLKTTEQHARLGELVTKVIGKHVAIVRMQDDFVRVIKPEYKIGLPNISNEVGFADGGTLLLTTRQSANEVNRLIQLDTPGYPIVIPIDNYRGNVEVDGFGIPFGEDLVTSADTGNVRLHFRWLCARCDVTTKDQMTGESNPIVGPYLPDDPENKARQPLYTLGKHRVGEYWPGKRGARFGVNVIPEFLGQNPVLERGMKLQVIKPQEQY